MDVKNSTISALEKAYDASLYNQEQWSMYDNLPYVSDKEIYNKTHIKLVSGNIIKYYQYIMKEPYEIRH
ncbi:MAG: hypothetical protein GX359_04895 [Clostridiales bacterium]|nr:hypothetical protein [Clostridiales bacterium]